MAADLLTGAGDATTRVETYQVVQYLLEHFGRTFTAFVANTRSRSLPARWALAPSLPTHVTPTEDKVRRLRTAHTISTAIAAAENDRIAYAWLIAANPRLDGQTPAQLIRDDDVAPVVAAAKAFLEGTYNA
ncbi:antitoxin Xre/MbcA/ParS toxin-binding domain-containing protein [Aldersonia kunmingensis]|uniref:antitoxin Xre/MbcA/ParS toxin-binding domain-containing protein n=1 Tax=Aldersonia kunmingensis TaxID=408066 RepID=UPI0009FDC2C2|nr:antitoxin Xre/MbcA/ParS toxin-binding domain-containing protein [Aldersonia kunmingensis]